MDGGLAGEGGARVTLLEFPILSPVLHFPGEGVQVLHPHSSSHCCSQTEAETSAEDTRLGTNKQRVCVCVFIVAKEPLSQEDP